VTKLTDEAELRDLGLIYAHALDFGQPELLRLIFTADAVWKLGDDVREGVDIITEIPGRLMKAYQATAHQVMNQFVILESDRTATVDTLCVASHLSQITSSSGTVYAITIRYHDDCVRTDEGWRIATRSLNKLWTRDYDVGLGGRGRLSKP
jgi:hypothetical protein